jgi:hypothetical protein
MAHSMNLLKIPLDALPRLLPDERLSVNEFLNFPLPFVAATLGQNRQSTDYISTQLPNITDIAVFQTLPTPPETMVHNLLKILQSSPSNKYQSITFPHVAFTSTSRYPLWLIAFWFKLLFMRRVRSYWASANMHLQNMGRLRTEDRADTTKLVQWISSALSCLSWTGVIQGFTEEEPLWHLHKYPTNGWLSTIHENQMLDLLHEDLHRKQMIHVEIEMCYFFEKLQAAHHENTATYHTSGAFTWPRSQGTMLARGTKRFLGSIAHCGGNHWVAVVALDFQAHIILYGNSLGDKVPEETKDFLNWWTYGHSGIAFTHEPLITIGSTQALHLPLLFLPYYCLFHLLNMSASEAKMGFPVSLLDTDLYKVRGGARTSSIESLTIFG